MKLKYEKIFKTYTFHNIIVHPLMEFLNWLGKEKWANEVQAGSVGINVPIPLPTYTHSFGGWKDSGFSETKAFGQSSIDFYTKTKSVATRWPDPKDSKVDLGFPKNEN